MGATAGVAGSPWPELQGVFLAEDLEEADWFVEMAQGRGVAQVDIWEVAAEELELLESIDGFTYTPGPIPPSRIRLRASRPAV